jgi:hypothetical protein
METSVLTGLRIEAMPQDEIDRARFSDHDVSGHPVAHIKANGGEPLRCCLRNAREGEDILLFGYEPALPEESPYREIGAVYTHATKCAGWNPSSTYPPDWYGRPQVLRAYDRSGWIHPSTTMHDGTDPDSAIASVLSDPEVVEVHSRNIAYGCFMFVVRREAH